MASIKALKPWMSNKNAPNERQWMKDEMTGVTSIDLFCGAGRPKEGYMCVVAGDVDPACKYPLWTMTRSSSVLASRATS